MRKVIMNGVEVTVIREKYRKTYPNRNTREVHYSIDILCPECNRPKTMTTTDFSRGVKFRHFECRKWIKSNEVRIIEIVINRAIHVIMRKEICQ